MDVTKTNDVFECGHEPIEVTSLHRPDTNWLVTDAKGHLHRWFANSEPATSYSARAKHDVPTLVWMKDGEEYYEGDDEPHDVGHLECRECGEHIAPAYTAVVLSFDFPVERGGMVVNTLALWPQGSASWCRYDKVWSSSWDEADGHRESRAPFCLQSLECSCRLAWPLGRRSFPERGRWVM